MTLERLRTAEAEVGWINAAGEEIRHDVQPYVDRVAREIASWVQTTRGSGQPSLFNRAAYVAPDNPYALMETAHSAVENDDVVGGTADVTEGLMLQGVKWESTEPDEADIFNQMSRDLDLDTFCRQWHREEFTYSQVIVGMWWGRKTYTVRGTNPDTKVKRKKAYSIACPVAMTFLNPMKVVPLNPGPFGQDRLAWAATKDEWAAWNAMNGAITDPSYTDAVMNNFFTGPVKVSQYEAMQLEKWHIDPTRLLALNPATVFRACRTKMSYERYPSFRLKSTFPLLDLKQQLMEADRVSLVGAANYILLVRQGDKDFPAQQAEIDNLKENFQVVAKLPVVIGDHRLQIDIITPQQEQVLNTAKYDTLDRRILARCLGALSIASSGQRNESTLTIARGVARQLENRRHMMKRTLERELARMVVEHPSNAGTFKEEPNLVFSPRNVQLDSDQAMVNAILALRTQNELSRESTLEYFGFDQAVEALRREFEDESGLDDIFKTQVPFASPLMGGNGDPNAEGNQQGTGESSKVSGARGGRPQGGGKSTQSPQSAGKGRSPNGNPTTGGK